MIEVFIVGLPQTLTKLQRYPGAVREALRRAVMDEAISLQRTVQVDHLSGPTSPAGQLPGVLGVRTDVLRSSINIQDDSDDSTVAATVGTNTGYGKLHEYGATIPACTYTSKLGKVFSRRSYQMPERSFLRSSLAERSPFIKRAIERAAHSIRELE
jgi:hypothetical protein